MHRKCIGQNWDSDSFPHPLYCTEHLCYEIGFLFKGKKCTRKRANVAKCCADINRCSNGAKAFHCIILWCCDGFILSSGAITSVGILQPIQVVDVEAPQYNNITHREVNVDPNIFGNMAGLLGSGKGSIQTCCNDVFATQKADHRAQLMSCSDNTKSDSANKQRPPLKFKRVCISQTYICICAISELG